jgi:hypothetical protein
MKTIVKSLLIAFILLLCTGEALAQRGLSFGFRVSPLTARTILTDSASQTPNGITLTPQTTVGFGLMLNFGLTENISIMTGFNYANLKVFTKITTNNPNDSSLLELLGEETKSTVSIPLGLRLRTPEFGRGWRIFANLGGVAEINTAYKSLQDVLELQPGSIPQIQQSLTAGTENIRRTAIAVVPRVGLDKETGFGTFTIGGSYSLPLQDFREAVDSPDQLNARISTIALDIGYFF